MGVGEEEEEEYVLCAWRYRITIERSPSWLVEVELRGDKVSSLEWIPQVGVLMLEGMPAGGDGGAADVVVVVDTVPAVLGVARDVRSRWRKESSTSKSPSVVPLLLLVDVVFVVL